jgi:hypothetical protein
VNLYIFYIFLLIATVSCQSKRTDFIIKEEIWLESLSGGSGILKSGDRYFVVGDDMPDLFELGSSGHIIDQRLLLDIPTDSSGRIEKHLKPDFEAMAKIDEVSFIILGSGSKSPERDICIQIHMKDTLSVNTFDLGEFYRHLRSLDIMADRELNIEGAAIKNGHLYLFNRRPNIIFDVDWIELGDYLQGASALPVPEAKEFTLPDIRGIEAGFSGATILSSQKKLLFTASVENTENAYDDGAILGSFIGTLDVSSGYLPDTLSYVLIPSSKKALKVESVAVEKENGHHSADVIMVTDEDNGHSHMIKGTILFGHP